MRITTYGLGGFDPRHPSGNRVDEADSDAGTFTRWDASGVVVEVRPLVAEELAAFPATPTAEVPASVDPTQFEAGLAAVQSATTIAAMRAAVTKALGAIHLS